MRQRSFGFAINGSFKQAAAALSKSARLKISTRPCVYNSSSVSNAFGVRVMVVSHVNKEGL